ncbi:MAG: magnesium transporter, partial [Muribaculaceae bacterium]|nr:magnesium transporter [Muribaculaceae bacterium]
MKEFSDKDIERISALVEQRDDKQAHSEIANMHPADIAEILQSLNKKDAEWLFDLIDDNELKADVLMELDEEERGKLLKSMDSEEIGQVVEELDTDDAVELIKELDEDEREEVISLIEDVEQAGDIVDLLQYDEGTAGGMMGTEMIVVNENWSMPQCLKEMRIQAEDMDEVYNIYVVDNDNRLRGVLPLKKMITHPSASKIKHVMETEPQVVRTDTPIDEVALDFEKYNLAAVAVVDSIGR